MTSFLVCPMVGVKGKIAKDDLCGRLLVRVRVKIEKIPLMVGL